MSDEIHCPFCFASGSCHDDGNTLYGCKTFYINVKHAEGCFLEHADEITIFYDTMEEAIKPWTNQGTHKLVPNSVLEDALYVFENMQLPEDYETQSRAILAYNAIDKLVNKS